MGSKPVTTFSFTTTTKGFFFALFDREEVCLGIVPFYRFYCSFVIDPEASVLNANRRFFGRALDSLPQRLHTSGIGLKLSVYWCDPLISGLDHFLLIFTTLLGVWQVPNVRTRIVLSVPNKREWNWSQYRKWELVAQLQQYSRKTPNADKHLGIWPIYCWKGKP